jgi:hypothetical protein
MPNHAGYGAAAVVRQSVLQDAILIYHRAGVLPSQFNGETPVPDPTRPDATELTRIAWDLFIDAPRITLLADGGGFISVAVRLLGPLRLRRPHEIDLTYQIKADIDIRVQPTAVVNGGSLQVGLNYESLLVDRLEVRTWVAPAMPVWLSTLINSDPARFSVQGQLRAALHNAAASSPLVLDQLVAQLDTLGLRLTNTTFKIFDGALGIGLDVSGTARSSPFRISGSADALVNFCPWDSNMAFTIHPDIATLLFMLTHGQIAVQARVQAGVTLDSIRFRLENPERGEEGGHLRVEGSASRGGLSGAFELLVKPLVGSTSVGVQLYRFNITSLPWWSYFLGIVAAGIITPVGTVGIFSTIVGTLNVFISSSLRDTVSGVASVNRTNVVTLPGASEPRVNLRIDFVSLAADGMMATLTATPNWSGETHIDGPRTLGPSDPAPARFSLVGTGGLFHPADPSVRIRWWVRRIDTGVTLVGADARVGAPNAMELTLDPTGRAFAGASLFDIYCRVYRPEGMATVELYRGSTTLFLADPLDRTHPFVRWRHVAFVPRVRLHLDGAGRQIRVTEGYQDVTRQSKIHRTAVPGRCRFAHRYSTHVLAAPDPRQPSAPSLEYLDELPFPRSELVTRRRRREVCVYCFFGGPDKVVPLI